MFLTLKNYDQGTRSDVKPMIPEPGWIWVDLSKTSPIWKKKSCLHKNFRVVRKIIHVNKYEKNIYNKIKIIRIFKKIII